MTTNQAIVCRIKTRPHPKADRLQLGTAMGFQVVLGLDVEDGTLGVFFDSNLRLSDEFCITNDLFPRYDEDGKKIGGGFFNPKNARVKAQTFRGEKSFGYWTSLESLTFAGDVSKLREGDQFDTFNDIKICEKYIVPVKSNTQGKKQHSNRIRGTKMIPRHYDTEQYKYKKDRIEVGDLITITLKMHGTSGRYGLVILPPQEPTNIFLKLWHKLYPQEDVYGYIHGTRNVLLDDNEGGYYGDNGFRDNVVRDVILHQGETIYFEIVGWVNDEKPIMNSVPTKTVADKSFKKHYGDTMTFKYGCPAGTQAMYVYRITRSTHDGTVTELSWNQVVNRCNELGINHVPELRQYVFDGDFESLEMYLDDVHEGEDMIDPSHIKEGVVVRVDTKQGEHYALKYKSYLFYVLEGIVKDQGLVDMEDIA